MTNTTATLAAGDCLPALQECHVVWMELEELIFAARFIADASDDDDAVRAVCAILRPAERLAKEFGDKFAMAIVGLGGVA